MRVHVKGFNYEKIYDYKYFFQDMSYIHLTKGTAARSIAQTRRKNNPTAARLLISSTA